MHNEMKNGKNKKEKMVWDLGGCLFDILLLSFVFPTENDSE